jgi:predicted nuclease of predicted toxin-antitoxin system
MRAHDCALVTRDADFNDLSALRGSPPTVLWLRLGTRATNDIEQTLRRTRPEIVAFLGDPVLSMLELVWRCFLSCALPLTAARRLLARNNPPAREL